MKFIHNQFITQLKDSDLLLCSHILTREREGIPTQVQNWERVLVLSGEKAVDFVVVQLFTGKLAYLDTDSVLLNYMRSRPRFEFFTISHEMMQEAVDEFVEEYWEKINRELTSPYTLFLLPTDDFLLEFDL